MTIEHINGVQVVHWNPRRNSFPRPLHRLPFGRRVSNFGDLLGPEIVRNLVGDRGLSIAAKDRKERRLLTVGSIMSMARDGDVIWGTGVNGKVSDRAHAFDALDVRAVRGPLTRAWLERRGVDTPAVFGDPALLVPVLWPALLEQVDKNIKTVIVPNFHDFARYTGVRGVVSPIGRTWDVVRRIASAERVAASSLHGLIIAEALRIPAVLLRSNVEPLFKYDDYFRGTGRPAFPIADDLDHAMRILDRDGVPRLIDAWSPDLLLDAFPSDLWSDEKRHDGRAR